MQEICVDLSEREFSMLENLLAVSDLLLGGHVTGYCRYFEKAGPAQM